MAEFSIDRRQRAAASRELILRMLCFLLVGLATLYVCLLPLFGATQPAAPEYLSRIILVIGAGVLVGTLLLFLLGRLPNAVLALFSAAGAWCCGYSLAIGFGAALISLQLGEPVSWEGYTLHVPERARRLSIMLGAWALLLPTIWILAEFVCATLALALPSWPRGLQRRPLPSGNLFAQAYGLPSAIFAPRSGRFWRVCLVVIALFFATATGLPSLFALATSAVAADGLLLAARVQETPDNTLLGFAVALAELPRDLIAGFSLGFAYILIGTLVVALIMLSVSGVLMRTAVRSLKGSTSLRSDKRSPILFLRSFENDAAIVRNRAATPLARLLDLGRSARGIDQLLAYEFASKGPVRAIGKPGAAVEMFGADRTFVADDEWQGVVRGLIAEAQFIVMVADETPGVAWEMSELFSDDRTLRKSAWFFTVQEDYEAWRRIGALNAAGAPDSPVGAVAIAASWNGSEWTVITSKRPDRHAYEFAARWCFADHMARESAAAR